MPETDMTATWQQTEKNAHEQASAAIAEAADATAKLLAVRKELEVAEKRLAEIKATIKQILGLVSQ